MTFIPTTTQVNTTTTAQFTQPAIGSTVSVSVTSTGGMVQGQYLSIVGGGLYSISSITNALTVVVTNLGDARNATASSTVATSAAVTDAGRPKLYKSASVPSDEATTSTTYTDLATAGPSVTMVTGTTAIITIQAQLYENSINFTGYISVAVSGATTLAASESNSGAVTASVAGKRLMNIATLTLTGLNAGTNTFTMKYRAENAGFAYNFENRRITVETQL